MSNIQCEILWNEADGHTKNTLKYIDRSKTHVTWQRDDSKKTVFDSKQFYSSKPRYLVFLSVTQCGLGEFKWFVSFFVCCLIGDWYETGAAMKC